MAKLKVTLENNTIARRVVDSLITQGSADKEDLLRLVLDEGNEQTIITGLKMFISKEFDLKV